MLAMTFSTPSLPKITFNGLDQVQRQYAVGIGEFALGGFGQCPLQRGPAGTRDGGRYTDDQLRDLQLLDLLAGGFGGDVQQRSQVRGFQWA